jgi:uncharacterized protein YceK
VKKSLFLLASLTTLSVLSGCGTILSGTQQNISITSTQNGQDVNNAACVVDNGSQKYYVNTPGTVSVDKSKRDISVLCEKDGMKSDIVQGTSDFNATTLLGVLLDFGIFSIPTDFISGGAWEYPKTITTSFKAKDVSNVNVEPLKAKPTNNVMPQNSQMKHVGK